MKKIWELRKNMANLELERARERLELTGDEFYAIEETYWIMVQNLNESFSSEPLNVASFQRF